MKVLVTDKLAKEGINKMKEAGFEVDESIGISEDEICEKIKDSDAIIVRSGTKVTAKIINSGTCLKVIGRAGTGTDNIDKQAAKEKNIPVLNTPFGNTISAAEHTVAMMLCLCRNIHRANPSLEAKEWDRKKYKGTELYGKTVGIIGLGNVGQALAKMLSGFNVKILVYDHNPTDEKFKGINAEKTDLNTLIKNSDFITAHVPLNDETRNMIDKKQFDEMKDSARVLNVGRGGVINEKALFDALKSGKVAGAALDVFESEPPEFHELICLENVVTTPHLGALTAEAQTRCGVQIAEKVIEALNKT